MKIFTDLKTGKFRGGVVFFAFEDLTHSKMSLSFEHELADGELVMDMEHAMACEFTDVNNVFIDSIVTINPLKFNYAVRIEADGQVNLPRAYKLSTNEKVAVQYLVDRLLLSLDEVPTEEEKSMARANKIGVHITHCCGFHGCKYGDGDSCPVEVGTHKQAYPCESCRTASEIGEDLVELKKELDFILSL